MTTKRVFQQAARTWCGGYSTGGARGIRKMNWLPAPGWLSTQIFPPCSCTSARAMAKPNDGEECLTVARREQPDVILLDYIMPKLDGFRTCQQLKADPVTRHIPVIFLSASVQEHERERGLALGAIGYLLKPFDPLQLPQQILDLLTRAGPASPVSS